MAISFLIVALNLVALVALGVYCSNKLFAKKQASGITFKDKVLPSVCVAVFGFVHLFALSMCVDVAIAGFGVSEVYLSGIPASKLAMDIILGLPSDVFVRSSGRAILCFVPSMVVFGFVYLTIGLCCGKKMSVHKSKLACVIADSQVNPPIILAFSFIPALVVLILSMSGYVGFKDTVTTIKLSESRMHHIKTYCNLGSAFITNTAIICDNRLISSKIAGVKAFDTDSRHVLVLWDKAGGDKDVKNYVIIREKGELEVVAQETDAVKLIDAHLHDF